MPSLAEVHANAAERHRPSVPTFRTPSLPIVPKLDARTESAITRETGMPSVRHYTKISERLTDLAHHAERRRQSTIDSVETLVEEARSTFASEQAVRESLFGSLRQATSAACQAARATVEMSARISLDEIEADTVATRRSLWGTASALKRQVVANHTRAGQDLTRLTASAQRPFATLMGSAQGEVSTGASTNATALVTAGTTLATQLNRASGPAREQVIVESKAKAAPPLAQQAATDVEQGGVQFYDALGTQIPTFNQIVVNLLQPLSQHVQNIGAHGENAVQQAAVSAAGRLHSQHLEARGNIQRMRQQALATIDHEEKKALAELERSNRQLEADIQVAHTSVAAAADAGLAALLGSYQHEVDRLTDSFRRPDAFVRWQQWEPLGKTAATRLEQLHGDHRQQLDAAAHRSVEQLRQGFAQRYDGARGLQTKTGTETESGAASQAESLRGASKSFANGLKSVIDSVISAAQSYVAPIAKTLGAYLAQVNTELGTLYTETETQVFGQVDEYVAGLEQQVTDLPTILDPQLTTAGEATIEDLDDRSNRAFQAMRGAGTSEEGLMSALRGITATQGLYLREIFSTYTTAGESLEEWLDDELSGSEYQAATAYLSGDTATGARYELDASMHWYGDDESRIENVLRSLSPEDRAAMQNQPGWASTLADLRSNLDGTDLQVTEALLAGNRHRADAYRLRDRINEARYSGDNDQLHTLLSGIPADDLARVQQEFSHIQGAVNLDQGETIEPERAADLFVSFATRPVEVIRSDGDGGARTETLEITGANRALAEDLARHGGQSAQARVSRLAVELQRDGGPNLENLETALNDPRLRSPDPQEVAQAQADRQMLMEQFAFRFGGDAVNNSAGAAPYVQGRIRQAFGDSELGQQYGLSLLRDGRPDPVVSLRYAVQGAGTNEALIRRSLQGLSREEIANIRTRYREEYQVELDDDLGTFGHGGTFTELSGDERHEVEILLMGTPRNDRERMEVARMNRDYQANETGVLGRGLMSGSIEDRAMGRNYRRMEAMVDSLGPEAFDTDGNFRGDQSQFRQVTRQVNFSAQNYGAQVDRMANYATTAIAIIGAVVAAVLTGGAATPLLAAAIAAGTGLTSMAANYALKGGRYGWEQAATDLGMTAVQAGTAGFGAYLGGLSRAGQLAGNPLVDAALIGGSTSFLNAAGQTALTDGTWDRGIGAGFGRMGSQGFRAGLGGAAGGLVSARFNLSGAGQRLTNSTGFLARGAGTALASGMGGFVGHGAELAVDRATGKYHGDIDDAFFEMAEAGGQAGMQGFFEGMGEALHVRRSLSRLTELTERLRATTDPNERARLQKQAEHLARHLNGALGLSDEGTAADGRRAFAERALRSSRDAQAILNEFIPPHVRTPAEAPPNPNAPPPHGTDPQTHARTAETETTPARPTATESETHRPPPTELEPGTKPPRDLDEGTAAAVRDSDFHGQSTSPGSSDAATSRTLKGAVRRLLGAASGEFGNVHLVDSSDATHLVVKAANGQDVAVHVRLSDTPLPADSDGLSPVASFTRNATTGEYTIVISPGAQARHVERALAHELAEIRSGHGRGSTPDVLVSGGRPPLPGSEPPTLSPHDAGRLAELGVIARQLETARTPADQARLRSDADQLLQDLGLAGGTEASAARRVLVHAELGNNPAAQALLVDTLLPHTGSAAALREVAERRGIAPGGGNVDEQMQQLPGEPTLERRRGESRRVGDRSEVHPRVQDSLRAEAREEFGRMMQEALLDPSKHTPATQRTLEYLTPDQVEHVVATGRMPAGFEFHHLLTVADFPELAHRGDVGVSLPSEVHDQAGHGGSSRRPVEAGTFVEPEAEGAPPFHEDPEARKGHRPRHAEIADGARSTGDVDRDILIDQQAQLERLNQNARRLTEELQRLTARAAEASGRGAPNRRLEDLVAQRGQQLEVLQRQIEVQRAAVEAVSQAIANGGEQGTAAAIPGSRFRGDLHPTPRADALPEAHAAARQLAGEKGWLGDIARLPDPANPNQLVVRAANGGREVPVEIRVVDSLPPEDGLVPVARFDQEGDRFIVRVSARAPEGAVIRGLGHELGEISRLPKLNEGIPGAAPHGPAARTDLPEAVLRPRGFGSESLPARARPELTPHDHGRLTELRVLAHQLEAAQGDPARVAVLRDEVHRLLASLGVIDETAPAQRRLKEVQRHLGEGPARTLVDTEAAAARDNPFLRIPPTDAVGYLDHLLDRLTHARAIGRDDLVRATLELARASAKLHDGGKVLFVGLDGAVDQHNRPTGIAYHVGAVANVAAGGGRRASLLLELMEFTITNRARPIDTDPARIDPQRLEAVRRRLGDRARFRDWDDYVSDYFDGARWRAEPAQLEMLFRHWADGEYFTRGKRSQAVWGSLNSEARAPDVSAPPQIPEPGRPTYRLSAPDDNASVARHSPVIQTVDGPKTFDSIESLQMARRAALDERESLQGPNGLIAKTQDPDVRERLRARLRDLQGRDIPRLTEALGEAAARRFARERFGMADPDLAMPRKGNDVPDLMFRDPATGRLVIVEAKGGEATLGNRLSADGTLLVQQGTQDYLRSLAAAMKRHPETLSLGLELEAALVHPGSIDYFVIRQPVPTDSNDSLPLPNIGRFPLDK